MQKNFSPPFELLHLGARLKEERLLHRYSQAGVSVSVGVSRLTQLNYESGGMPTLPYLNAIATLGFDVAYVLTGVRAGKNLDEKKPGAQ